MDLNRIIMDAGNNKVKAIQTLREGTTLGLKEAKGIIDEAYKMRKANPEYDANLLLNASNINEKKTIENNLTTAEGMTQYCLDNGFGKGFTQKRAILHFQLIEKNLSQDENVLMAFMGLQNYVSPSKHDNNYAYAITNKRILFAQKKIIGEVFKSVLFDNINDISVETGMLMGVIVIDTIKEKIRVGVEKSDAQKINSKLHDIIYEVKNNTGKSTSTMNQQKPMAEQLKELKELLDLGILTESEFNEQKKGF